MVKRFSVKKMMFPCAVLIFCFCFVSCTSVDQAYESLKNRPYPFDDKIDECIQRNFPHWSRKDKVHFIVKVYPLTDAGSTAVLMSHAEKNGLLPDLELYADEHHDKELKRCLVHIRQQKNAH